MQDRRTDIDYDAIIAPHSGTNERSDSLLLLKNVGKERQRKSKKEENIDVTKNMSRKVACFKAFTHVLMRCSKEFDSRACGAMSGRLLVGCAHLHVLLNIVISTMFLRKKIYGNYVNITILFLRSQYNIEEKH